VTQPVPLLDLKRPLTDLAPELTAAFERVLHSGHYILGPEVDAFETEAASYCGARHALGVSSGTDALLLALMAVGVGAGDEVVCPTYTFFATAGTVWRLGARPVLVDCCPACFNSPPEALVAALTDRTRAVIPVHLFGQTTPMAQLLEATASRGVAVIEDAAQALGAEDRGKRSGSMGTVGCFSFFPSKNLGAFGDAGLVTCQDEALAETLRVLRVHGGKPKYYHSVVGGNFRIDALQAALLRVKLPRLDGYHARRQRNAALYTELFRASGLTADETCICGGAEASAVDAPLGLPVSRGDRHIYNQYTLRIRHGRRDAVRARLVDRKIGTEIYYPVPMHLQPCFASLGHSPGSMPHAEAAAAETLALPIFPELTPSEIEYVAREVIAAIEA
jgi:dTDP-4-amino-4,6-dideoxygalactose transaminase